MRIILTIFMASLLGGAAGPLWAAVENDTCTAAQAAEVNQAATAIQCKQDNCPNLDQPDAEGLTPDAIYYFHCSTDAIELRNKNRNASIAEIIDQISRIRVDAPPKQYSPAECFKLLQEAYPGCEIKFQETPLENVSNPENNDAPVENVEGTETGTNAATAGACALSEPVSPRPAIIFLCLALGLLALLRLRHRPWLIRELRP